MLTRLLASTAVAALIASGAYAQSTESEDTQAMEQQQDERALQGEEIVVRSGDTIVVESADAEFTLRLSKDAASAVPGDTMASQSTESDDASAETVDSSDMTAMDEGSETASEETAADASSDDAATATDDVAATASDDDSSTADRLTRDSSGEDVMVSDGDILLVDSNAGNFQLNFEIREDSEMSAATGSEDMQDDSGTQTAVVDTDTNADNTETASTTETDDTVTSAISREGMHARTLDQIRAEDLIGSTIYGANDENIGTVGDVLLTQDGQVDAVLVDVGGFLGIGTREVAIGIDDVQFMVDDNEKWYVYSPFTEEQLEAHPAYDAATYADQRDQQRLIVR